VGRGVHGRHGVPSPDDELLTKDRRHAERADRQRCRGHRIAGRVRQYVMVGSLGLIYGVALLFIAANLAVGITFSTLAKNQLQAVQMAFFVFLPSILLSGFMFPFRGMPPWAQVVGEVFPLTHFLRIVRGILLKGNGLIDVSLQLWQIALFALIVVIIGIKRYRQTLD